MTLSKKYIVAAFFDTEDIKSTRNKERMNEKVSTLAIYTLLTTTTKVICQHLHLALSAFSSSTRVNETRQ